MRLRTCSFKPGVRECIAERLILSGPCVPSPSPNALLSTESGERKGEERDEGPIVHFPENGSQTWMG